MWEIHRKCELHCQWLHSLGMKKVKTTPRKSRPQIHWDIYGENIDAREQKSGTAFTTATSQ